MLRPFSLFVGLRYSLTRKNNLFLSFVSLISMLGISLGVLILIVALSVINGSIVIQRDEALKSVPHVTLQGESIQNNYSALQSSITAHEEILASAPFVEGEAMVRHQGGIIFLRIRGIDPELEAEFSNNDNRFYRELLQRLSETRNGIVLGAQLAAQLGIYNNAEVSVLSLGSLLAREEDAARGFEVLGLADFGLYGNNNIALVNLAEAQALFVNDPATRLSLQLKVSDVDHAGKIAEAALGDDDGVTISPWYEVQASLFNALNMEKMLTSFMLLMIVVIGAVNIISTLVMVVSDKGADIAILRTMGASRASIMAVFMVQGLIAGLVGVLLGGIGGVLMARYVTDLSLLLERAANSIFENANIYLISHLQTRIEMPEVFMVCLAALGVSFLATLYPAYRAGHVQPAEVLRYE